MNNIPKDSGLVNKYISYPLSNIFVPLFYNLGFTPNLVTTLTLILRIIIIYNMYHKKNYTLIIILFFISWITDGMDGQLARNYNMKSKFGETYDITVDLVTMVPIILLFFVYYKKNRIHFFLVLCFIPLLSIIKLLKMKCIKNNSIKEWEKFFNNENINIKTNDCKYLKFVALYDEGLNYLIVLLFMIYTFYFHKE